MSRTIYLQSEARLLNPVLSAQLEAEDYASDPESARAEWGGEFRSDDSQAFADADIDFAVIPNQRSAPAVRNREYAGFADLSGGRHDSAALAIAHKEKDRVIVDRIEVMPSPHDPQRAVARFAEVCREYHVDRISADNYGADWSVVEFAKHGVILTASKLTRSEIYAQAMPLFTARIIDLPDLPRLILELRRLERRPRARGGDSIDHPRNGSDDVSNAACGAAVLATKMQWVGNSGYAPTPRADLHRGGLSYDPHEKFAREQARLGGYKYVE